MEPAFAASFLSNEEADKSAVVHPSVEDRAGPTPQDNVWASRPSEDADLVPMPRVLPSFDTLPGSPEVGASCTIDKDVQEPTLFHTSVDSERPAGVIEDINFPERSTFAPRPISAGISEWRQIQAGVPDFFDTSQDRTEWGVFTGVLQCAGTPKHKSAYKLSDRCPAVEILGDKMCNGRDSSTFSRTVPNAGSTFRGRPLGEHEGFYPIDCTFSSSISGWRSSAQPYLYSPPTNNAPRPLTATAVSNNQMTLKNEIDQILSPMVVRQLRPITADPRNANKSRISSRHHNVGPVTIHLDDLGGATVTFAPLGQVPSSYSPGKPCHTVAITPHREFPKTAISFCKRAMQNTLEATVAHARPDTPPSTIIPLDELAARLSTPNSPSKTPSRGLRQRENFLSPSRARSPYKLAPKSATVTGNASGSPRTPGVTSILTARRPVTAAVSPSTTTSNRLASVKEVISPITEHRQTTSSVRSSIKSPRQMPRPSPNTVQRPIRDTKSESSPKQGPKTSLKTDRGSVHAAIIHNVRDVPVAYDFFMETPLRTHDRNIMHTLGFSAIELCALGLHDGRTMTSRARAISAMRKRKEACGSDGDLFW